jgi:palmitoyltransferase
MEFNQLAVPAVYVLIFFLGYPSQILFIYLDPAPLTKNELVLANVLLVCIFITYSKSVFVDPGTIPKRDGDGDGRKVGSVVDGDGMGNGGKKGTGQRTKWCRKCDAAKPPRAHHCKECKRQEPLSNIYFLCFIQSILRDTPS